MGMSFDPGLLGGHALAGSDTQFQINSAGTLGAGGLFQTSANVIEQYNGTNAQAFRLYNTRTDGSNYERSFFRYVANVLEIGHEAAGTGQSGRSVILSTAGDAFLYLKTNNVNRIIISSGGVTFQPAVINMANLPTSDPAAAGQLWNNSGVVNVSAG